ncbi:resolvase/ N terminal domain protein [Synechococcus sp. BOUM118]|nr:resolvase/ N terminal domain protein [Synechococcus sp. BOUM118]
MGETNNRFVLLLRVSTRSQRESGLGLEAQRRDIQLFLNQQENPEVVEELVEVESGASEDRPVLERALALCREHRASLLVQKVDRLTRDLELLARIVKDQTVQLRVASLPNADNFQIHLYGALASAEREFVSLRTKAALAACKARGGKLGNPQNLRNWQQKRQKQCRKVQDKNAGLVCTLRKSGKTLREICSVLNDAGITTSNGGIFYPSQIARILDRVEVAA